MTTTISPTSPAAGSQPNPGATSEPAGSQASPAAPAAATPGAPVTATSGQATASGPPATAPATAPPTQSADQALEALLAEADTQQPPDNEPPVSPAPPAAPATTPAPPKADAPPATPPPADPAPETDDDATHEPTPTEQQAGNVPLKKLTRLLNSRRKTREELTSTKAQLDQERMITDKVIGAFHAAGVGAENLPAVINDLARARSDPQAQARVLAAIGVQIPQPSQPAAQPPPVSQIHKTETPHIDLAAVKRAIDAYDLDGAQKLIDAAMATPAAPTPSAPQPPATAPPAAPTSPPPASPVQPPSTPSQPDLGRQMVHSAVLAIKTSLERTVGDQETKRLSKLIDTEAEAILNRINSYGVPATHQAVIKAYQEAHGTVLSREKSRETPPVQPPTTLPPAQIPAARAKTADELMEDLARG